MQNDGQAWDQSIADRFVDISFLNPQQQTCCRHDGIEDLDTFVNTSAGGGLGVYT